MKKILFLLCLSSAFSFCTNETAYINEANFYTETEISEDTSFFTAPGLTRALNEAEPETDFFPESFDLRTKGIVTPVREQENYGTCWAIAATDSAETQIIKNGFEQNPDLSEWHLAYFSYSGVKPFQSAAENVFNSGGTNTIAAATLSRWVGSVYEEKAPYAASYELDPDTKFESDYKLSDAWNVHALTSSHIKHSNDFLKELIYNENAVSATYYSRDEFYNPDTFSQYCPDESMTVDHAVILIGWDDNYPKENFKEGYQPSENGAWLAKNSWGEDWGDSGFFWISYEDVTLCEAGCFFSVPGDTYSTNYQYDETGWTISVSADGNQQALSGYMANVFTAENDDPVTAVSFYTTEDNAEYEITVYTDVELSSNKPSPVNGKAASSVSGTHKYSGFHTVTLDEPVKIRKGEQFSVAVKLTNHESPYMLPVEASSAVVSSGFFSTQTFLFNSYANEEKDPSYISFDGKSWYTTTGKKYSYEYPEYLNLAKSLSRLRSVTLGNVCLKAYSSHTETAPDPFDINRDGSVDTADFVLMMKIFYGTEEDEYITDLNNDGTTNIADLILLKSRLTETEL